MKRRVFLKALGVVLPGIYCRRLLAIASNVTDLQFNLQTPGRVGFYIDYSERNSVGQHVFYVCRTHGTTGAVSVDYTTLGDAHSSVSGTLTWPDGDASIKSFSVDVPSKGNGEHRIWAQLSNPTGGAVLHYGDYTRAYGVIDDGTVAGDSDAVFYDGGAAVNGDGTQGSPYNSIYDAISNIGSKRYLYGKGATTPDGTNSVSENGGGVVDCIFTPQGRTGESDRLFIRNWPGSTWTITGGAASNKIGFYCSGGIHTAVGDYLTFRGIRFSDLDASSADYAEGGGIGYFKNGGAGINVELCAFLNINGATGSNTSGFNCYAVDGAKVWRCTSNNIMVGGDSTNGNTSMSVTYDGKNISIQRCEMANSSAAVYHKRVKNNLDVSMGVRFCRATTDFGVKYAKSGAHGTSHSYTIVQGNAFVGCPQGGIVHEPGRLSEEQGEKHWWCNNVFENCGSGERAAIEFYRAYSSEIFNNIFLDCRRIWREPVDTSDIKTPGVEYADYNHDYGTTYIYKYEWRGVDYSNASSLFQRSGLAEHDETGDPKFIGNEYILGADSPCAGTGVSSTDKGVYLAGIEMLGVGVVESATPPAAPSGLIAS